MKKTMVFILILFFIIILPACGPKNNDIELTNENIYTYLDWSFQKNFVETNVNNYYTVNYSGWISSLHTDYEFNNLVIVLTTSDGSREFNIPISGEKSFSFSDQMVFEMFPYQSNKMVFVSIKSGTVDINFDN